MTTEAKPFIPIIDFSGIYHGTEEDKKRISLEIDQAARTSGFLVIKGHGVSKTIIDNAWKDTKDFFDLSEEEKMKYTTKDEAKYPFGYSGMGMEVLSAGK